MLLQTNVTAYKTPEELGNYAENGFFIHGLFLEGAAWELGGQGNEGYLIQAKLKELHPKMPVINVISVQKDLKKVKAQYQCPVYITSARGPTYVFTANLQMQDEEEEEEGAGSYEWILAGVALLMSDD
jgi:dynein heavy chain